MNTSPRRCIRELTPYLPGKSIAAVQRELGLMGEFATLDDMSMALAFSSASAMAWWRSLGAKIYPARFVEHVNKKAVTHEAGSGSEDFQEARRTLSEF